MELTKEQLLQIDNYIYSCGIKFYDVRTEIVDHFANILEQKLDKNPDLNFKKEIENIQLVIFVAALLFYWSCQIVFFKNKKVVQEQYPNVIV
jgi:hypothetical protein